MQPWICSHKQWKWILEAKCSQAQEAASQGLTPPQQTHVSSFTDLRIPSCGNVRGNQELEQEHQSNPMQQIYLVLYLGQGKWYCWGEKKLQNFETEQRMFHF